MNTTEHYCTGCKTKHSETSYRWKKDGKKYYCGLFTYCVGCKKFHRTTSYMAHRRVQVGEDKFIEGWLCSKWVKPRRKKPKLRDMSPADVMSGVDLGMDRQECYGDDKTAEDWSTEKARQDKILSEIL